MTLPLKNALIIPQKATYEIQDQKYVFVVDKNGKLKSQNIKVGYEFPDLYVVSSGLSGNEKILLESVYEALNEAPIDYEGPERMEPGIERKITSKETPYHEHPAMPGGDMGMGGMGGMM